MRRKLLTTLLAALAVTILAAVPVSASAATLKATKSNGTPATGVYFNASTTTISSFMGSWTCEDLELGTLITKNAADPIEFYLGFGSMGSSSWGTCQAGNVKFSYSNFQRSGPMTMNADLTGSIGLKVTETWTGTTTTLNCVRAGVLDIEVEPGSGLVSFNGDMNIVSGGSACPMTTTWAGWFDPPTAYDDGLPINWVVTP